MFIKLHSLLLEEINFGSRSESLGGIYKALSIISFYLEKHIKKTPFSFHPLFSKWVRTEGGSSEIFVFFKWKHEF